MKIGSNVIELIKKGMSLNKIKEKTGINKSSLYYHYKKIKGKKYKEVSIDINDKEKIGGFLGIFSGDGNFFFEKVKYHYRIRIFTGLHEEKYSCCLKRFFNQLFSKKPRYYVNIKNNVSILEYKSKKIYNFIKEYLIWDSNKTKTIRLRNIRHNKIFLIGFLRGLLDTDGNTYRPKRRVSIGTSSERLYKQIYKIMCLFDLKPCVYKNKNEEFWNLCLHGEKAYGFINIIKPNNPNKKLMRL